MSAERWQRLAVRTFPASWRARYGEELDDVLARSSDKRSSLAAAADLARAGIAERLRAAGLTGDRRPQRDRALPGVLLVLSAWALAVLAGCVVQKTSEHWQHATSATLPIAAFDVLVASAAVGSSLVLAGVAVALPAFFRTVRAGGWPMLRRPIVRATACSAAAAAATTLLVLEAQRLTPAQRDGRDTAYAHRGSTRSLGGGGSGDGASAAARPGGAAR